MADFLPYITETPPRNSTPTDALGNDPINLVFYGNAPVSRVVSFLQAPDLDIWKPDSLQSNGNVWSPGGGRFRFTTQLWAHL